MTRSRIEDRGWKMARSSISARIPQLNRICRERGGILEQRRRPNVKLQSHFAPSHIVAISLAFPPSTADRGLLRGKTPSTLLRKDCVSRFLSIVTVESGFNNEFYRTIGRTKERSQDQKVKISIPPFR